MTFTLSMTVDLWLAYNMLMLDYMNLTLIPGHSGLIGRGKLYFSYGIHGMTVD